MQRSYDLIGDVHGCGHTLETLLQQMGYSKRAGVYQHPKRKAVFIGDIIDRGPHIREACHLVRDMVEAGSADITMGNHEYNLVTYFTPSPEGSSQPYLRPHTPRNTFIIEQTLEQFANHRHDFDDFLDWFLHIPVFLEYDDFRAVHASWDHGMVHEFQTRYGGNTLNRAMLDEALDEQSFLYRFLDTSLRGTSIRLPEGRVIECRDGMTRKLFRVKFWGDAPKTYQEALFQPDPLPQDLAERRLSEQELKQLVLYPSDARPLFVGHYWMSGEPDVLSDNVACIDYSAVKYGRLVAYRMDGEQTLNANKFTWVCVDRS